MGLASLSSVQSVLQSDSSSRVQQTRIPYFTIPSTTVGASFSRPTTLITPDSYNPSVPLPLILLLHATGETTASIKSRMQFVNAHMFDDGCLLLVPDAVLFSGSLYFNYWDVSAGDFTFMKGIVDEVKSRFAVSSVWGVGYSDGAFMTLQLSLQYPLMYDAIFTFAGAGGTNDSTAVAPKAIHRWHYHGTTDATILPAGDPIANIGSPFTGHGGVGSTGYVDTATTVAQAAARNGVVGSLGSPGTAFDLMTTAGNESAVELYSGTGVPPVVARILGTSVPHGLSVQSISSAGVGGGTWIWQQMKAVAP